MFRIYAENRQKKGTGASRRLRRVDKLPAIIYGGKELPTSIILDQNAIMNLQHKGVFYTTIISIIIAGTEINVKVKAVQRHPFKPKLHHIDFMRITSTMC
ncbi:50S ribosomal protein L25 [Candidatus Erwinia haradaeae]|uniref:Large ribosomal subunit protein bL25 n=1 Tax=Candidatus Erwinia haradaeae TaxID=1922217 RepID=A0A451DD40_9GAMM|nr:50S ribosomal protein L25 [Candidatus Erwinia haradaeae]VFP84374.1 50S ribosomal protein L25 [Candidatus Erwinia haradaeae]